MPVHVIKKGETLIKIAKQYGIKDWRKGLYEHKDNQAFRKKNPDPETIPPGEKLVIPEPEGGAQNDWDKASKSLEAALSDALRKVESLSVEEMLQTRYRKFRAMGIVGSGG
jgi:LysM repeat protein